MCPSGNRIGKSLENGTSVSYSYDNTNRMTQLVHRKGSTVTASFGHAYDELGRMKFVKREDGRSDVYCTTKSTKSCKKGVNPIIVILSSDCRLNDYKMKF
jgi:hypothetical protein